MRLKAWKMKPTLSRRRIVSCLSCSVDRSVPPMNALPALRRSSPATQCISVDLPEPDGPHDRGEDSLVELDGDAVEGADFALT